MAVRAGHREPVVLDGDVCLQTLFCFQLSGHIQYLLDLEVVQRALISHQVSTVYSF